MVIISIGEWLLDHKVKVSARSAPRPFCSAKPSGLWRNLHFAKVNSIHLYVGIEHAPVAKYMILIEPVTMGTMFCKAVPIVIVIIMIRTGFFSMPVVPGASDIAESDSESL